MESNGETKPLTTDQVRSQAAEWTLAGDVGLLAHLEQFSQEILKRTRDTQAKLDNLVSELDTTTTTVNNVTNKFLALQNSQFVENRVYDEETTTEDKKIDMAVPDKAEQERLLLLKYKEAVGVGLKLLDTHYEQVELLASSDSEDETSPTGLSSLVWKSKNPYASKPFPLVIGSAEWWADDSVGLGDYDENMESEKVVSDTDSDMEVTRNIEKRVRLSPSSESESEGQLFPKKARPPEEAADMVAENHLFPNIKRHSSGDMFSADPGNLFGAPANVFDDDEDVVREETDGLFREDRTGSVPRETQHPQVTRKVRSDFTKELSAKLGSVVNQQRDTPPKPTASDLFSRQSGQGDLFGDDDDDDEDYLFSGAAQKKHSKIQAPKPKNNLFGEETSPPIPTSSKLSKNDLFGEETSVSKSKNSLFVDVASASKPKNDLFSEKSSINRPKHDLFGEVTSTSNPQNDLFGEETSIAKPKYDLFGEGPSTSKPKKELVSTQKSVPKPKHDLFGGGISASKPIDDLFGEDSPLLQPKNDLFGGDFQGRPSTSKNHLFDDHLFSNQSDDLFGERSSKPNPTIREEAASQNTTKPNRSSNLDDLFGSVDDEDNLFTVKKPNPRISVIRGSTGSDSGSPGLKFSTPTANLLSNLLPAEDDLFGGVSDIASESGSRNYSGGPLNSGRIFEIESQDLGTGDSSVTDSEQSVKSLTEDQFHPAMSSTRAATTGETSDYKSHMFAKSGSSLQDSSSAARSKMGHTEQPHFPRAAAVTTDTDDDLFSSPSPANPIPTHAPDKPRPLFEEVEEDLFATVPSVVLNNARIGEEDNLFADAVRQADNVSVSSSRSSLFDDVSFGKSTLPSVFSKSAKPTAEIDDLFGEKGNRKLSGQEGRKQTSLFGDLDDADDLFGSSKPPRRTDAKTGDEQKSFNTTEADAKRKSEKAAGMSIVDENISPAKKNSSDEGNKHDENTRKTLFGDRGDNEDLFVTSSKPQYPVNVGSDLFADSPKPVVSAEKDLFGTSPKPQPAVIEDKDLFSSSSKPQPTVTSSKPQPVVIEDDLFGTSSKLQLSQTEDNDLFSTSSKPTVTSPKPLHALKEDEGLFSTSSKPTVTSSKPQPAVIKDDLFGISSKIQPSETEDKDLNSSSILQPSATEDKDLFGTTAKPQPTVSADKPLPKAKPIIPQKVLNSSMSKSPKTNRSDDLAGKISRIEDAIPKNADMVPVLSPQKNSGTSTVSNKEPRKPEPPKSLSITKNTAGPSSREEVDGGILSANKPKKIGKLNIPSGLNINVGSLLPGAKPTKYSPPSVEVAPAPSVPEATQSVKEVQSASTSEEPSVLLRCSNKDRAKIQVRRRPQSRRARQEALRTSGIDFGEPRDQDESPVTKPEAASGEDFADTSSTLFHSIENSPDTLFSSPLPSNPLSPSTDEEDYFNVPELDVNFEKEDQSIFKTDMSPAKAENRLLFDGAPMLSPVGNTEDLYSSRNQSSTSQNASDVSTDYKSVDNTGSLFDNSESGDSKSGYEDLFGIQGTSSSSQTTMESNKSGKADGSLFHEESQSSSVRSSGGDLFETKPNLHAQPKVEERLFNTNNTPSSTDQSDPLLSTNEKGESSSVNLAKQDTEHQVKSLFNDDSDEMFASSASTKKLNRKSDKTSKLFNDSDDEEEQDLFGQKPVVKAGGKTKLTTPRISKNALKTKVEKDKEPFVDPLGLMGQSD